MQDGHLQTTGFQTTLDLARRQSHGPTSVVAGIKRTQEQRSPYRASSTTNGASIAPKPDVRFKRPSLEAPLAAAIEASDIYDIGSSESHDSGPGQYTQRIAFRATPGPTQNPLLSLSHPKYGLPDSLLENLSRLGIRNIYPWQSSCLLGRGLLTGEKNLVYSAPTGGGKSLVADMLLLKRVIDEPGQKAMLVLPYVALVQEKLKWLRKMVDGVHKKIDDDVGEDLHYERTMPTKRVRRDIRVAGFFGGSKTRSSLADVDIAVCVIEKVHGARIGAAEWMTDEQAPGQCHDQCRHRRLQHLPARRVGARRTAHAG